MKIIFLSPVHPFLTEGNPLPRWQMQASRVRALLELGHQVKVIRYTPSDHDKLNPLERIYWNLKVLTSIIAESPDLVIFSLGADVLFPATIHLIKALVKAPLIVLSGVSPIVSGNPRERKMAPLFDLVATNDDSHCQQWLKLGAKKAINLPLSAFDPELHYPRQTKKDIDLLFIGTLTDSRQKFFKNLKILLPKSVFFVIKQFIWEEEYACLMSRAKIVLNPLRPEMENGANLRMFEVPAFGALLLGNSGRQEWLVPGQEMIVYKNTQDAADKIIYYLKHESEREAIIKKAMARVKKEHTFLNRARKMFRIIKSKLKMN